MQGDEPLIDVNDILNLNKFAIQNNSEIATLACKLENKNKENQNVVKVISDKNLEKYNFSKAIKFTRDLGDEKLGNIYHLIGIYIYKVSSLLKFVSLNQTPNEIKLRLEQLRALENNMKIDVVFAKSAPVGVDTNQDYLEMPCNINFEK